MKDFKTRILSADYGKRFRQLIAAGICILVIGGGASAVLMHTVDANAFSGPQQVQQFGGPQPGSNEQGQQPGNGQLNERQPGNDQFNDQQPGHGHGHFGNDQPGNMDGNDQKQAPDGNNSKGNNDSNSSNNNNDSQNSTKGTVAQIVSYQTTEAVNNGSMSPGGMPHDGPGHRSIHHGGFLHMILHNSQVSIATKAAVLSTTILGILWVILTWFTIVCYLYRTSTFSRMNTALWTVLGVLFSLLALIAFFIARSFVKARCDKCGAWQDYDQTYCTDCGNPMRQTCTACGASVPQSASYCASCGKRLTL